MGEVNWLVSIGVALVLSIPVGIIVNLATPPIQKWRDQRALSTRGKKLEKLQEEYDRVKGMHDDFMTLYLRSARANVGMQIILFILSLGILIILTLSVARSGIDLILVALMLISLVYLTLRFTRHSDDLIRLSEFDKYQTEVVNRIKELEESVENAGGGGE